MPKMPFILRGPFFQKFVNHLRKVVNDLTLRRWLTHTINHLKFKIFLISKIAQTFIFLKKIVSAF
jgi:hypothetical protein